MNKQLSIVVLMFAALLSSTLYCNASADNCDTHRARFDNFRVLSHISDPEKQLGLADFRLFSSEARQDFQICQLTNLLINQANEFKLQSTTYQNKINELEEKIAELKAKTDNLPAAKNVRSAKPPAQSHVSSVK